MIKISPSILSSDFANLQSEIEAIKLAGADMVHVDVMDGHFVPNISIGTPVIASIKKITTLPLDVHLMISDPLKYAKDFAKAGSDIITFHIESESDTQTTINKLRELGVGVGLSIKPKTPVEEIIPFLSKIDMVLVMMVEPGFGGQSFMEDMCGKIETINSYRKEHNLKLEIQIDGGITSKTAPIAAKAGADILVAGSAIFGAKNYKDAIDAIRLSVQ